MEYQKGQAAKAEALEREIIGMRVDGRFIDGGAKKEAAADTAEADTQAPLQGPALADTIDASATGDPAQAGTPIPDVGQNHGSAEPAS